VKEPKQSAKWKVFIRTCIIFYPVFQNIFEIYVLEFGRIYFHSSLVRYLFWFYGSNENGDYAKYLFYVFTDETGV